VLDEVLPQTVFAAAAVTLITLLLIVNPELKLLNDFSRTLPPRTAAPLTSSAGDPAGPTRTPTDVSEESTTVVPRAVADIANWLPITNFLPNAISRFSETVQYLSVLL
jgi:hypothetical protein